MLIKKRTSEIEQSVYTFCAHKRHTCNLSILGRHKDCFAEGQPELLEQSKNQKIVYSIEKSLH